MLNVVALEGLVEGAIAAARVPGLALALVEGERVIYARGFGVTCVEPHGRAVTPDTLFRIGSVTKPLTGTAIMRLVDAGKLDLDTPVREYVPWFTLSDRSAVDAVTPRRLLSHTAGLPHDHKPWGPRDPTALERRIREQVPAYPLVGAPGEKYSYSNTGIHTLAYLIEVLTGTLYPEAMQDLVFRPLQMEHTTFDATVAMTYPIALAHRLEKDGSLAVEHHYPENAAHYASGQAISSVLDLANFAMAHMHGGRFGRRRVLRAASVKEMHRPHVSSGPETSYGLTFSVDTYKGLARVGHGGAIANFGAVFKMLLEPRFAVIALFNRLTGDRSMGDLTDRIVDLALELPA